VRLTNGQKKALHAAARQAGLDDAGYRTALRNFAGVRTAADPGVTRVGFISVMAFLEHTSGGRLTGCDAGYWQGEMATARPADALLWRIRRDAVALGWNEAHLNEFLASDRMSSGRFTRIEETPAVWLVKVLEALKAMRARHGVAAGEAGERQGALNAEHGRGVGNGKRGNRSPGGTAPIAGSSPAPARQNAENAKGGRNGGVR